MAQLNKLADLVGFKLHAIDGDIGRVREIYFDDRCWVVRYFVVRTGKWLRGRDVLIMPEMIKAVDYDAKQFDIELTQEQVRNAPPVETETPASLQYEEKYNRFYESKSYWISDPVSGYESSSPSPREVEETTELEHPHLRSSTKVSGYTIRARDGKIGQVRDFILGYPDWNIQYLEIDTQNRFLGKRILISPKWIQKISWANKQVQVELNRDVIRSAPAYNESDSISWDYEEMLSLHYGSPPRPEAV